LSFPHIIHPSVSSNRPCTQQTSSRCASRDLRSDRMLPSGIKLMRRHHDSYTFHHVSQACDIRIRGHIACLRRGLCKITLGPVRFCHNPRDIDIVCPRRELCKTMSYLPHPCCNPPNIDIAFPHHVLRKTQSDLPHPDCNPRDIDSVCPRRVLYKT
jgi:hypothetical protein